jgi:heme/copper-type cytochrome/quinol oxidase subunit 2
VSDEVGAMVFLFGAIILPIIGLIAFVIWAIFHERNHSKKMKEDGKEDSMSSKQLFTILLIVFALMALPKTIVTILSFFD